MAYIHGFVSIIDPSSDNFAVVHENTTDRGLVRAMGALCLYVGERMSIFRMQTKYKPILELLA